MQIPGPGSQTGARVQKGPLKYPIPVPEPGLFPLTILSILSGSI